MCACVCVSEREIGLIGGGGGGSHTGESKQKNSRIHTLTHTYKNTHNTMSLHAFILYLNEN